MWLFSTKVVIIVVVVLHIFYCTTVIYSAKPNLYFDWRFRPHFPHRGHHHRLYWGVLQLQCSGLWFIATSATSAAALPLRDNWCVITEAAPVSKCFRCETAFSFPRWLVGLVTPYISDERWAEIALGHRVLSSDRLHRSQIAQLKM